MHSGSRVLLGRRYVQHAAGPPPAFGRPLPLRFAAREGRVWKTSSPNEVGGGRASGSEIGRGLVNSGSRVLLGRRCVQAAASPPPAFGRPLPLRFAAREGRLCKPPPPAKLGEVERAAARSGGGWSTAGCGCCWDGVVCKPRRALPRPSADPSHFASLRVRGGFGKPPPPAKLGEVERAKQDREGVGQQRVAGVVGTALCASRGGPSPGLTADPSHFASLRGRGGFGRPLPSQILPVQRIRPDLQQESQCSSGIVLP